MEIQATSEGIYRYTKTFPDKSELTFSARDVRENSTGLHAHIGIMFNNVVKAHDLFNTARSEERARLAKRAWAGLPAPIQAAFSTEDGKPLDAFIMELDAFCLDLLIQWRRRYTVEDTFGSIRKGKIPWLLKPFILDGAGTAFFGAPGTGKSYICMLMAQSIQHGVSTFWPTSRRNTLYINLERSKSSMEHRLALINNILGLPEDAALPMLHARGHSLKSVEQSIQAAVREREIGIIFIDSLSRAGTGSLTGDETVNNMMDIINRLCKTWAAIGHTPREDTSHIYGSIMHEAAEDVGVQVASENREVSVGLLLQVRKANDIPTGVKEFYAMEFDPDIGLINFRVARATEFPELANQERKSILAKVTAYLQDVDEATATIIATSLSLDRANVSALLNSNERFVRSRKEGREQFFGLKTFIE